MKRPVTTAVLRIAAAFALCATMAACTTVTTPAPTRRPGPTVYATNTFAFPSDTRVETDQISVHVWEWDALTEAAAAAGLITAYWQADGGETWQTFPHITYDQDGTFIAVNLAYGPGAVILNLISNKPIPAGETAQAFEDINLRFRVTVYHP